MARQRKQSGYVYKRGGWWVLRYRQDTYEGNQIVRKQLAHQLAEVKPEHLRLKRPPPEVERQAEEFLRPLNGGTARADATRTLSSFVDDFFLPWVKENRRGSTHYTYKITWERHLKPRCGDCRLGDFRTVDGEQMLAAIGREAKPPLTHSTLGQLKVALSAIFTQAIRLGFIGGPNPITPVSIPKSEKLGRQTGAYTREQVVKMLEALPEPERTIVAVAFYAGLRRGEIRGLDWADYKGDTLTIQRSIYRTMTTAPKSRASRADVAVVAPLQKILDEHRWRQGNPEAGPIFTAPANHARARYLEARGITPTLAKLGIPWLGWHAFRRGVATQLHASDVPDVTIQKVLRHEDVRTTQSSYIKTVPGEVVRAMSRLVN
jgi:integrase